jgi:hypothetical protein
MGRPMSPRPMSPIFLGAVADSKECLLKSSVREARRCCARKEEMIVTELRGGSSEQDESTAIGSGGKKRAQTREGNFCRGATHFWSSRLSTLKSMGFEMQALQPDCKNRCCSVTIA